VTQTIVWTALPDGAAGEAASRRLRLSVFVSPRLTSDEPGATLAQFPDLLDWPGRLAAGAVAFFVQARAGLDAAPDQAVLARIVSPPPDPDLWRALFSPSTPVESHAPDAVATLVNTYSVGAVHQQLRQGHLAVAASTPVALPTRAELDTTLPLTRAFLADAGPGRVMPTFAPNADDDPDTLRGRLHSLATQMFRPDDASDVGQRVASALVHARELSRRTSEVLEVLPRVMDPDTGTSAASDLARLVAFTRGPVAQAAVPTVEGLAAPGAGLPQEAPAPAVPLEPIAPPPPLDLHRALSLLADHPTLLRRLGLVLDLEISAGSLAISPGTGEPRLVQVIPAFAEPLAGSSVSPFTAYVLEGGGQEFFTAAPADREHPQIVHGMLDLAGPDAGDGDGDGDGEYDLVQVDVQGGGLKLINALADRTQATTEPGTDDVGGLPSLRTSGISVIRAGHGVKLVAQTATAVAQDVALREHLAAGGQDGAGDVAQLPVLHAEDLVRGYRFDVRDSADPAWRSLHARVGTYTFPDHPAGPTTLDVSDEGAVQLTATQPYRQEGIDPGLELYVSESLVQWDGWSLAAPRPGRTATDAGPAVVQAGLRPSDPQLVVSFRAAPRSLPRLRFGRSYRVRARVVDLAGNGPTSAEADELLADVFAAEGLPAPTLPGAPAQDMTYSRFEPVTSPVLVPRERFADGESLQRLVVRSRAGVSAAQEAAELTGLVAPARPGGVYRPTCERHVVPPKASLQTVERHGLLDRGSVDDATLAATYNLARKEKGRLADTSVVDVTTGQPVALPDPAAVETVATGPRGGGYLVHHEERVALPYLPDPFARSASLCGLPGVPTPGREGIADAHGLAFLPTALPTDVLLQLGGAPVRIPFFDPAQGDGWPQRLPFRLALVAAPPGPHIPPTWDPQARLLNVALPPAEQVRIRLSSALNRRDLVMLGQWRWLLDAHPELRGDAVAVDVAEHGGRWQLTPPQMLTLVHAVEAPLASPDFAALTAPRERDTTFAYLTGDLAIHGRSTAKVDLVATWRDSGDHPGAPGTPAGRHVFEIPIHLPGDDLSAGPDDDAVVPIASYDATTDVVHLQGPFPDDESGRTFLSRHEFGDTRHRMVTYEAIATSRFRDCFPPEVADDPVRVTRTGAATTVDVPSSAPPPAPDVVSVLPTFAWTRRLEDDGTFTSRRAGGIRVYLRRPWYSSGDGEQLAVVLADPAQYPPDDLLRHLVTHWGRDPVWVQPDPTVAPVASDFPRAASSRGQVSLEEAPGQLVAVAGHDVGYDDERDLVVCDIAVEPTPPSYFPFVRLALARFQPSSVPGCELSRVVLADQVQVPPERTVTATPGPTPGTVQLEVAGFSAIPPPTFVQVFPPPLEPVVQSPAPAFLPLVDVEVQERDFGTDPDIGWRPVRADAGAAVHPQVVNRSPTLWRGTVTVPADAAPGRFRIVIREIEPIAPDAADDRSGLRVVFAEVIPV
jgi:hypothetical protein